MDWLHHPKFRQVRDDVLGAVKRDHYRFRKPKKLVFLCGGKNSSARGRLKAYLLQQRADVLIFYAEDIWNVISAQKNLSALALEAQLAKLADVVIVVESAGAIAELGAFSLNDALRAKLLPILDVRYEVDESFLNTGPIRWVNSDSLFTPAIWTDLNSILEAAGEIDSRLNRLPQQIQRIDDLSEGGKHLLLFICDLVAVFGPCPTNHIEFYLDGLGAKSVDVALLLTLGCAMDLLTSFELPAEQTFFFRPLENGKLPSFHYTKKHLGIPSLRAKVLSKMQSIDSAKAALSKLETIYAGK